ncbi:MAG: hypothetical protein ACI8ZX_000996 [Planctomycetota bacterium]|jgi:hypothetical protein
MKNVYTLILLSIVLFSCKKEIEPIIETYVVPPFPIEKTENWMQDLLKEYPSKIITLKDICIPRAHDAGMYEVNNCFAGNSCNTQTQDLIMKNMLESGIRTFDVRPTFKDSEFWTYHKSQCGGFGCDGVRLGALLDDTKNYLETHNELVILEFSHFCDISYDNVDFLSFVDSRLGDLIYKEPVGETAEILDRPLSEMLSESNVSGKVLLKMNQVTENKSLGYYDDSSIPFAGTYANKFIFSEMKTDQLAKFSTYDHSDNSLFRISWTLTMNTELAVNCFEDEAVSIQELTVEATNELANTVDEWISGGTIAKGKIPNILSVDFANTSVTEQCIRLSKLNIE